MVFSLVQMDVRSIFSWYKNTIVFTQSLPKKNSHCSEVRISWITTSGEDAAEI